nr:restriction endonuclease subunit S [uncultured Schaedlerella sp.]
MPVVKLDDVAIEVKETYKGDKTGYPIVGLEHISPGEVALSNWSVNTKNTFSKIFRKGDILFGRRRAYLKKAAIAPFDGICSGDITVIRAKSDKLYPELLPFIIQNDDFFDYAVEKSAGSLSPRVKWEHLKNYTFKLPSLEKQKDLAELFWSINDSRNAYQKLLQETDELIKAQFIERFGETGEKGHCTTKTLQDLIDMKWITYHLDGNHGGDYPRADEFVNKGIPYISANCIVDDRIDMSLAKYVTEERANRFRKGIAKDGDVLFAHNATVGPVAILKTEKPVVILGTSLTAYRCNKDHILGEYLMAYMKNPLFIQQYERNMQQTTRKQVPITTQRKYTFIIPLLEEQKEFAKFVNQSDKSKIELKQTIEKVENIIKSLVQQELK